MKTTKIYYALSLRIYISWQPEFIRKILHFEEYQLLNTEGKIELENQHFETPNKIMDLGNGL